MHKGSCHCGKVSFEFDGEVSDVIECNCSHCSRKGYLLAFAGRESLRITSSREALAVYTFNKHVIQHHFCRHCGCAPFGLGTAPGGRETVAINVRCLEGIELATLKRIPYDGRSL